MGYKTKEQRNEYARKYRKLPSSKKFRLDARLQRQYGIDIEARDLLLELQGGVCAICGTDTPTKHGWCVDHDHITKRTRGILCSRCNHGLGNFKDSVVALQKAIHYLLKAGRVT